MEVSRLTFTKETKEKMSKPLNRRDVGKLRWAKLKELDKAGMLSNAKTRTDITRMMGLGTGYGVGYSWISNLIQRGYLKETIYGKDANGQVEFEYHIVGEPDYHNRNAAKSRKARLAKKNAKKIASSTTETSSIARAETDSWNSKMVIRYKDLTIEVSDVGSELVERVLDKLANR